MPNAFQPLVNMLENFLPAIDLKELPTIFDFKKWTFLWSF